MSVSNNVNEFKDNLNTLVGDFVGEYIELQTEFKQMKQDLTHQLETMSQSNQELKQKVSDLETKVNEKSSLPVETSENKFDIIRGQAKEIALKDKEIIRLTEELTKLKETQKSKAGETHGWSPTSCPTPTPNQTEPPSIQLDTNTQEDIKENDASTKNETDETDETNIPETSPDNKEESEEEEEFEMITYRKVDYFLGSGNKVYKIVKDEDGDDDVGEYMGDWVQQKSGKFKLVKH